MVESLNFTKLDYMNQREIFVYKLFKKTMKISGNNNKGEEPEFLES